MTNDSDFLFSQFFFHSSSVGIDFAIMRREARRRRKKPGPGARKEEYSDPASSKMGRRVKGGETSHLQRGERRGSASLGEVGRWETR